MLLPHSIMNRSLKTISFWEYFLPEKSHERNFTPPIHPKPNRIFRSPTAEDTFTKNRSVQDPALKLCVAHLAWPVFGTSQGYNAWYCDSTKFSSHAYSWSKKSCYPNLNILLSRQSIFQVPGSRQTRKAFLQCWRFLQNQIVVLVSSWSLPFVQ